ncbi:hypothetical protein COLO4_04200 [Corchorus olitorius]|uniref:Helitron helicase-like domain-containing protein n=1 Tax=Corchorus olitorius TaxID=93759 RepID=A0A1R3KV07_9ROSI|nr:hypothetical protein COLO4_04200 [Corchorus olitorius]
MLDSFNELVRSFRYARDMIQQHPQRQFRLKLIAARESDSQMYNPPTTMEIAALIPDDIGQSTDGRDVIIQHRGQSFQRINDLHPLYIAMQYPLLFPYGQDTFHSDIPFVRSAIRQPISRKCLTMRDYYAYLIQQRFVESNSLLRGGRLFQQFVVDVFATIEEGRLRYIRQNQSAFRFDMLQNVRDAVSSGDYLGNSVGTRVILPGPRYLFQNYHDSLAICRSHGYPTLFITFTCNPRWPEIEEALRMIPIYVLFRGLQYYIHNNFLSGSKIYKS